MAERAGQKPVTLAELESDPSLADKVLGNPTVHEQDVIDRAWQLAKESDEPPQGQPPKSGRGFVTPDGKFLDRNAAKRWMKQNEPDVHEMWEGSVGEDAQAELHSEDYSTARMRVSGRNVAQGDPDLNPMSPRLTNFLTRIRGELNKIKAGFESARYGHTVLRTLFSGPRNMLRAEGEQVVSRMRKLIPDHVDQEALSFLRDYKDDPNALRADIEEIRGGSNEKLKAYIPSMERALNPSPEMLQADSQLRTTSPKLSI